MPCINDPRDYAIDPRDYAIDNNHRLDAATAAACEMGKLIAKLNATEQLTKQTRRWLKDHAAADTKRFEQAKKEVEAIKQRLSLSSAELRGILDQGDDDPEQEDVDYFRQFDNGSGT